jgi:nucleotide-binding universal stress UspA family protein
MFHSLLVPLDGTRFSEHALPMATDIARATGASVHLARVHVARPPDGLLSNTQFHFEGVDMDEYEDRSRGEERRYLDRLVSHVRSEAPVEVDGALLEGDIAHRLEDHARATGADAVILTTHAREGLARAWAGSVAESLIRTTTLPVLALRWHPEEPEPPTPEVRSILVPLDGSALAEAILVPALDLAAALGAKVFLMHAVHSGMMGRSRQAEARTYLRRMAKQVADRGIEVDTVVTSHGTTAEAICMAAREVDADLIALATHGRTGLGKAVLGSVTLDVLHHSDRPLLIRRPALA